jgi:hypothetical protein
VVIFLVLVCCTEKSGNPGEDAASLPQKKIIPFLIVQGSVTRYVGESDHGVPEIIQCGSYTGLPDGLFSYQNPNFGTFWRALEW